MQIRLAIRCVTTIAVGTAGLSPIRIEHQIGVIISIHPTLSAEVLVGTARHARVVAVEVRGHLKVRKSVLYEGLISIEIGLDDEAVCILVCRRVPHVFQTDCDKTDIVSFRNTFDHDCTREQVDFAEIAKRVKVS